MGLATIDPHSQKVQTKLYKIPKFGVKDPIVSKIQPFENAKFTKKAIRALSEHSFRMAIHVYFLTNFDVFKSLYLSQN